MGLTHLLQAAFASASLFLAQDRLHTTPCVAQDKLDKQSHTTIEETASKDIAKAFQNVVSESLRIAGAYGGYCKRPTDSLQVAGGFLPYYYDRGKCLIPNNSRFAKELSDYITQNLPNSLTKITPHGYKPIYSDVKVTTLIEAGRVTCVLDLPFGVQGAGDNRRVKLTIKSTETSKLYEMLDIARFHNDLQKAEPNQVDVSALAKKAHSKGLKVEIIGIREQQTTMLLVVWDVDERPGVPSSLGFLNRHRIDVKPKPPEERHDTPFAFSDVVLAGLSEKPQLLKSANTSTFENLKACLGSRLEGRSDQEMVSLRESFVKKGNVDRALYIGI